MSTYRKTLIAGNWKMHLSAAQASLLVRRLQERVKIHKDLEVVIAPPSLYLQPLSLQIDHRKFKLASQNAYFEDEGAYTGEISFTMLRGLVKYAIIGHSERRHVFGEKLEEVQKKVTASYRNSITPILCVGETKMEKLEGFTDRVLHDQVTTAIANLTSEEVKSLVIAYEPVWAIGTGENAKPDDVVKSAKVIRHNIEELYGKEAANEIRILYGGSVKADTASGYVRLKEIDGLLVGGASLNYHTFSDIIDNSYKVKRKLHTSEDK